MASTGRPAWQTWACVAAVLSVACLMPACHPVSHSNFKSIEIGVWTREGVHELFGDPAKHPASIVMPDREVYYQSDRLDRPCAIVYYDEDGRVIWKEWKRSER